MTYTIRECDPTLGKLTYEQVEDVLEKLPFEFSVSPGEQTSTSAHIKSIDTYINVYHSASVIEIMPPRGMRFSDVRMKGNLPLSSVFDECLGGNRAAFHFNTQELGLPFAEDIEVSLYKTSRY